jgi:hypothetical protein
LTACLARGVRSTDRKAALGDEAKRHSDRLLRDSCQQRKIPYPHPFRIEDAYDVGADGQ